VPSSSRINFGKERFGLKKELCAILGGPDKSGTISGGLVQVRGRLVQTGFFSSNFDDSFERNLLTVSLIDLILLPLVS
jgi:hypothetical protein